MNRNLISPLFTESIRKLTKEGNSIHRKLEVRTACKNYYYTTIGKYVRKAENSMRGVLALKFPDKLAKIIAEDSRC